jgi:hypothetical protein
LPGHYESEQGGFNEVIYLNLKSDGTYLLQHLFIGDVVAADGKLNSSGGEDSGMWSCDGNLVVLKAASIGTERSPMFLPAYCDRFEIGKHEGVLSLTSKAIPAIPAGKPTPIVLIKQPGPPAFSWARKKTEAD